MDEKVEEKSGGNGDIVGDNTETSMGTQEDNDRVNDGERDRDGDGDSLEGLETVYVNNLNDKVSLNKIKGELENVFQKYGKIIQITAHKNLKMKGQAFVTFENKAASRAAIDGLQEHEMFGRPIHVEYAKGNSDNYYRDILKDEEAIEIRKQLKLKTNEQAAAKGVKKPGVKKVQTWKAIPPNKILLIQSLKPETTNGDLLEFFEAYGGFIHSRLVKARNLSFIEFENEASATSCLEDLTKEKLEQFGSDALVTYAKK
ncbi:RNA recognition motif RRM, RBD, or RNP domain-containing protein [Debaryomyces fabryi]|uniref:RNA recognition motif RRM, RBD, or RNP domain-containing protein n=1 Tax=Debaryomyces fabryi TaxID=58627 RepID=A0A0V1PUW0_9ASCO|nr:RNA recognition motif RRM, RBD, or RNP domain-containing protein [Debaryomyces fabryi]KRZ99774.1 RNA recognition motif RRM, RBD, or RNP domain-containing protein [Debaryomyces fabryi]CUM57262.1 unnamed protein product [Debaryomyces fabryi]